MQILVTEYPESPRDCLFSTKIDKHPHIYACSLHAYIEEADFDSVGRKPHCICPGVEKCEHLAKEIL